jgi:BirA family biotin operon repressor/biotin-[acetyl-CoA-carboxylase] ligase
MPLVSLAAGLAIAEAVERASPTASVRVKWPNDVVIADAQGLQLAKIAGILAETSTTGSSVDAIVVGVGINVLTRCFPDELAELATSVTLVADRVPDRAEILADALAGLDRDVPVVLAKGLGPLHDRLARKDALAGRLVRSDASYGIARGIDAEGRLVVEREGRREAWSSGEVHLVSSSPAERREGGSL